MTNSPIWRALLERAFRLSRARTVLDLGCGPYKGEWYADTILSLLPAGGLYVGVDRRAEALEEHRRRGAGLRGDVRLVYVESDFAEMDGALLDGWALPPTFDLVLTKCFVCLFFDDKQTEAQVMDQVDVINHVARLGRWWAFYDSFNEEQVGDVDKFLQGMGGIREYQKAPEGNPPYTRAGICRLR